MSETSKTTGQAQAEDNVESTKIQLAHAFGVLSSAMTMGQTERAVKCSERVTELLKALEDAETMLALTTITLKVDGDAFAPKNDNEFEATHAAVGDIVTLRYVEDGTMIHADTKYAVADVLGLGTPGHAYELAKCSDVNYKINSLALGIDRNFSR